MTRDRGSATAELAAALPAVVLLLVAGVAAIAVVGGRLGCIAAARDAALQAARGGAPEATLRLDGELITAIVRRPAAGVEITCEASALREPGMIP